MTSATLQRICTVSASTKRAEKVVGAQKYTAAATYLTGLRITPLDPVDPELRATLDLQTPAELLQTTVNGAPDIIEGDVLVVASREYPIRSVAQRAAVTSGAGAFLELVIEELKR